MKNYTKLIDFSRYSSLKIGPKSEVLVINEIGDYSDYTIIGKANNILVSNSHPKFAILGEEFDYIKEDSKNLYVGCATTTGKLLSYLRKNNLANLEFLGKLPGSLGGVVKMNAGLKSYEIFNYIKKIKTAEGYISRDEIEYGYRYTNIDEIVYEVVLEKELGYSKERFLEFNKMRENQPSGFSAGSCFKNPVGDAAGRLLDLAGLKGFKRGSMSFSSKHANFLMNEGGGNFEDAKALIELAKEVVKEKFQIELKEEIIVY